MAQDTFWPGRCLADFRNSRSLTVAQLSLLIDVPATTITSYGKSKHQRRIPSMDRLAHIEIATAGEVPMEHWLRPTFREPCMRLRNYAPRWKNRGTAKLADAAKQVIMSAGTVQLRHFVSNYKAKKLRSAEANKSDMMARIGAIKEDTRQAKSAKAIAKSAFSVEERLDIIDRSERGETLRAIAKAYTKLKGVPVNNVGIHRVLKRTL